jgi:hypothetical protein
VNVYGDTVVMGGVDPAKWGELTVPQMMLIVEYLAGGSGSAGQQSGNAALGMMAAQALKGTGKKSISLREIV